ncbi:MAG TPA: hypothetical protein DEP69_06890 [Acidimicrobiaceae bacterium]|nr:hypothetical protein [Acidimicrobiaceae bacterium]
MAAITDITTFVDKRELQVTDWRKGLVTKVRDKNAVPPEDRLARQRSVLRAAHKSSDALAKNLRSGLGLDNVRLDAFPLLRKPLSDRELATLQRKTAIELHEAMNANGCTRRQAASGSFWLYCVIHWLEADLFPDPPAPTLIRPRVNTDWLEEDFVLTDKDGPKQGVHIDDRTRDLLRSIGGVPHIRDRTAFWVDCSLAHLWWAAELAGSAAKTRDVTFTRDAALDFLLDRNRMTEVVRWVSRRAGRLAQTHALAGALEAALGQDAEDEPPDSGELKGMMHRLARRSRQWRLGPLSPLSPQDLATLCFD